MLVLILEKEFNHDDVDTTLEVIVVRSIWLLMSVVSIAAISFAEENEVELQFEYFYYYDQGNCFELTFEHWPGTIETRLYPLNTDEKNWAALAFSLRSTPKIHEQLRIGLAFDIDQTDNSWSRSYRRSAVSDDRLYLYGRSEFDWATIHLLYPLAQRSRGHDWYWRIEIEDLRYPILSSGDLTSSIIADAVYSPDPALGFNYDYGLRFQYQEYWLDAKTNCLSIGCSFGR